MLNLLIVNFAMGYLAATGFFFVCCMLSEQGREKGAAVCLKMSALVLLMIPVKMYKVYRIKRQSKCCGILRKDSIVIKQIGFRRGKPMLVKSDLIGLVPGDRIVQFHHNAWRHDFKVIEGIVEKDGVIWVTGHIEPVMSELDACVIGWSKLSPQVQSYLTTKA